MHAKNNSLSEATRSLSQGPRQTFKPPATKTDPLPDLMFDRHSVRERPHGYLIPCPTQKSTPQVASAARARLAMPAALGGARLVSIRQLQVRDVDPELL